MGEQYRERVAALYADMDPLDLAMRVVDLEDELGSDVDGICTGMHADVAEAQAEIERLTKALAEARLDVDYFQEWAEFNGRRLNTWIAWRRRYRLAWLSARRRAAEEANLGAEAVQHLAADRDRWQRRAETAEARLLSDD